MNQLTEKRSVKIDAWLHEHDFHLLRTDERGDRGTMEWYTASGGQMLLLRLWPDGGWDVYGSLDESGRVEPTLEALNFWVHK